jgi:hypothetical protein
MAASANALGHESQGIRLPPMWQAKYKTNMLKRSANARRCINLILASFAM